MNGIFLAYGAAIEPGVKISSATLLDLAPTILYLMSAPVPDQMDGRILREAITPGFQPLDPQETATWADGEDGFDNGQGLTEDQKRVVADRLRGLGYVG